LYRWIVLVWICDRRSLLMDITETRSARVCKMKISCYFSCVSMRNWVEFSQSILTGYQKLIRINHYLSLCTAFFVSHLSWIIFQSCWCIFGMFISSVVCESFDSDKTFCVLLLLFRMEDQLFLILLQIQVCSSVEWNSYKPH
jgi:hypothetical protein